MSMMTAAALEAASAKLTPKRNNDPTVKYSIQRRQGRPGAGKKGKAGPASKNQSPKVKSEAMDVDTPPTQPERPFTEYVLLSSKLEPDEQYCLVRFKAPNPDGRIEIGGMPTPLRLNRKNPKSKNPIEDITTIQEPKWRPTRGQDGTLVMGKDGKPVMSALVDGKEILQSNWGKEKEKLTKAELEARKKKAPFKKKTRQIFTANPESRSDPQERFPWVFESAGEHDSWTGRKNNMDDGSAYGVLCADPAGAMKFVPVPRQYDFVLTKTHAASKSLETAEAEFELNKRQSGLLYSLNVRHKGRPDAKTKALLEGGDASTSSRAGKGVKGEDPDTAMRDMFGSDDEGDSKPRKGDGGDADELDFEEEHADDEDNVEPEEMEDDESKASKARIKREQLAAKGTIDEDVGGDSDEEDPALSREGRRMKRNLKKRGEMGFDDSDDEDANPYASEESEEEDDSFLFAPPPPANPEPATPEASTSSPKPADSKPGTPSPSKEKSSKDKSAPTAKGKEKPKGSNPGSKAPTPAAPRGRSPMSGAAVVAQRATSPAPRKQAGGGGSRASTPAGNYGGRATSPLAGGAGSRAGSPLPPARPSAPPSNASASGVRPPQGAPRVSSTTGSPLKRKADDASSPSTSAGPSAASQPSVSPNKEHVKKKVKKDKPSPQASGAPPPPAAASTGGMASFPGMITEDEVLQVLRAHPEGILSTELINMFKKTGRISDERNKDILRVHVKNLATNTPTTLPNGQKKFTLTLRQA
ncbi:hypothetical protein DL93DRAFT_2168289 [Clavulina sp. PMI_390]|nr:hypothetical protein DL93DRAFT_2168289 [Clavulina sp. PMI_390]